MHNPDDDLDLNALLNDDAGISALARVTSTSSAASSKTDEDAYVSANEGASDASVDDDHDDGAIAPEGIAETLAIRLVHPPHALLNIPITQETPLMTEDMSAEREARRKAAEAIMRMRSKQAVWVFTAWKEYVQAARDGMRRALARWASTELARALDTWADFVESRKHALGLARKALARAQNALLAKCFLLWAAELQRQKDEKAKTQQRAMALMSGKAELLLRGWWKRRKLS